MRLFSKRLKLRPMASEVPQDPLVVVARRWILVCTLVLTAIGSVMVFSSSTVLSFRNHNTAYDYGLRHLISVVIGLIALVVGMRMSQRQWRRWAMVLLVVCSLGLFATLALGSTIGGQRNWVPILGVKVQPSELAKIPLILCIAIVAGSLVAEAPHWRRYWGRMGVIGAMLIAPVLLAGDAGTPAIMIPIAMVMVIVAGAPWRPILYTAAIGAVGGAGLILSKSYRLDRLGSSWFNPFADPSGSGYQSAHGQYAIGGGGWLGVGLGAGREKWGGLPAAHTDFILASIAEETGVIIASLVILMLAAISFWFLRIALHHEDFVARSVCAGVGVWVGWQSLVNVAMVVNVLPVIGVTLPLVSFGGTSMVATLAGIGMGIAFLSAQPASSRVASAPARQAVA